ncbi:hypothetical protein D3Z51_10965 [Clostridiaceae bacterium]|nr:hypothetical protein [Clostridiaceae bacterium]RKI13140.1 hypothetical protein D7V81_11155 [bacterium 1XD21-70]
MGHPGQRIQVDVKFVPSACLVNSQVTGKQFFQHTAIDEYSRWRFVDVEFISCMEDILDIYETPYHPAVPVVCMDEKPYQLLGEVREPLPMRPGDTQKVDSEYIRNGTCSIFTFVEPLGGIRHVSVRAHRTAIDWADEIRQQAKARHANSYQEPDNADPFFHFSKSDHDQAKPRNAP